MVLVMKGLKRAAAAVLVAGVALGNIAHAETLYNIMDIGTLGGSYSRVSAINTSGQMVGISLKVDGSFDAFVTTSNGQMTDLGTLGGIYDYGSEGIGINASGQVVGSSYTALGSRHAFVTNSIGQLTDLGTLGGDFSIGTGINSSGQIVGTSTKANGTSRAFVTNASGQMIDLGIFGGGEIGRSYASGINASGQVVGSSTGFAIGFGNNHAFVTDPSGTMIDLGLLPGGWQSYGLAINDSGQVTGSANMSYSSGGYTYNHAFVTNSSGQMIDLGTLGGRYNFASQGNSINASGQVVGFSGGGISDRHAFVAENGRILDLNALLVSTSTGWILNEATGINDSGLIVGNGMHNGVQRAFLLTPVAAVPVPAAFWLFTSGLGLLAFANRRKDQGNML